MSQFNWKGQHTALVVVFTVWMVSYLDRMVMSTAIPYIAKDFSLSAPEMGIVMSAFFAGYALCQIPGGILSDRFGARKVLVFAIVWWSIFTFITGWAGSLMGLLIIRLLFGIGEGIGPAATWKTLAVWTPASKRGKANSIMLSTNSLGPAIAPLFVVGIMAYWGWQTVFYALAIPGLLVAVWVWFSLPDNPADKKGISPEELAELAADHAGGNSNPAELTFFQVVAQPAVWKSFLLLLCGNTAVWGYMAWLPTYLVKNRGMEMLQMGITASLPFFAGFIGAIVTGYLIDGIFKNYRVSFVVVVQLLMATFLYLMYNTTDPSLLIVFNIITGFFCFCCMAVTFSMPMMILPREIVGRAMGIVNTGGQLAAFTAPIIMGFLIVTDAAGKQHYDAAYAYLCFANIAAAIVVLFFNSRKKTA
ncbi:MFS transporter [Betaproteobacteria bacterium]|nr:MFS transporter [Betaproteobacteria bacterium]